MSETRAPATPSSSGDGPPPPATPAVLAGDWSEGLRGPKRAHGIAPPRRVCLEGNPQGTAAAPEPLPDSAPTPWSEPVPDRPSEFAAPSNGADGADAWQMPAPAAEASSGISEEAPAIAGNDAPATDDAWIARTAEPVQEWQPEAPPGDWEEVRKPDPGGAPESAPADWSTLRSGPDWSAPAASSETSIDAWGAAPPAAQESQWAEPVAPPSGDVEWSPPPSDAQWSAPPPPAADEWETAVAEAQPAQPEAEPPSQAAAWNSPAVGASALEQLDSEPMAAVPGAAQELFGSVPFGGTLAGNEDDPGVPEELASPEEVLRPVAIDHDDPDLPEPTGEPASTRAQPLAAFKPTAVNAMAVDGEHRVAVHTRGGRTLRGTMRDVDLSKSHFPLVPQGGGEPESIYRAEVKAIFFMLAPGEPPHAGDGGKVKVIFADGRVIEGVRDGADAKHGFFLVPHDAARTNTRRIYVAREATAEIKEG